MDTAEAPEYHPDGFGLVEPLAIWWEFLPVEERLLLDPRGALATFFHKRKQLLTRAHRVEMQLFGQLPEAALAEMFHNGKLAWLIGNMDQRLGRMVDRGERTTPVAASLASAVKRTRDFALRSGYEQEHIGTLFGLERFEREQQRTATTAG